MSHPDLATLMTVAWEAANSAGEIVRENWHEPKTIEYKGAIDLVTSVDRESERKIVAVIRRHFPGHSILAEEETDVQGAQNDYRWIIDPLDGTTNFAHSYPQFCVSIAVEHSGRIILGLVYDPVRRECFKAILRYRAQDLVVVATGNKGLDADRAADEQGRGFCG